jgi:hypothetical protein
VTIRLGPFADMNAGFHLHIGNAYHFSLEVSMCVEVVSCLHCYIPLHIRSNIFLFPVVLLGTSIIMFACICCHCVKHGFYAGSRRCNHCNTGRDIS